MFLLVAHSHDYSLALRSPNIIGSDIYIYIYASLSSHGICDEDGGFACEAVIVVKGFARKRP